MVERHEKALKDERDKTYNRSDEVGKELVNLKAENEELMNLTTEQQIEVNKLTEEKERSGGELLETSKKLSGRLRSVRRVTKGYEVVVQGHVRAEVVRG